MLRDFGKKFLYTPEMDELDRMMKEIDEREEELTEDQTMSKNNINPEYRVKRVTNSRGSEATDRRANGTFTALPSTNNRRDGFGNTLGLGGPRANSSKAYRTTNADNYYSGGPQPGARTNNFMSRDANRPRGLSNTGYGGDQYGQGRVPRRANLHNLDQENLDYISQDVRPPRMGNFTKNNEGPVRLRAEQGYGGTSSNPTREKLVGFGAPTSSKPKPPIKRK